MDVYRTLQSWAAQKRDRAIAHARRQYRRDIQAIEALEQLLPAPVEIDKTKTFTRPPSCRAMIQEATRPDTPFTVSVMLEWLQEAHPACKFNRESVRTHVSTLCTRGFFRRLYKTGHMETMYIAAESTVQEGPIENKSIAAVTDEILRAKGRPMRVTEIMMTMRENGYRADTVPDTLRRAVRDMFNRYPGRFSCGKDGRWEVA